MKFKYYLRGAGVGMIVTAIILMIAFSRFKPSLSNEDIIKEAGKLGMIMPDEDSKDDKENESSSEDNKDDNNDTGESDDNTKESESDPSDDNDDGGQSDSDDNSGDNNENPEEDEYVVFVIRGGEFSDVISNHLFEKGLIDDAEKYNKWLMDNHLDEDLQPGTYTLKKGMTYAEIAEILSTRTD